MRFAFAAATLSLFALGCPLGGQSKPARAQEAALELNLNARFGRMEMAAEHVAPKARDQFFDRRKAWGGSVRVADYDLTGLKMQGEDDAETFVKVAWYRANEGDLRVTTLKQKWHDFKGDWKLTEETRIDGDLGLLGEPPALNTAPAAAPRRSQFPTVYLGLANALARARRPRPHPPQPPPAPGAARRLSRSRRCPARPADQPGEGVDFGGVDFFAVVLFAAVFFGALTARSRLRRAFFLAWPLRRVIFCDLRRSNLPMGAQKTPLRARRQADQPADSATASSRLRTSRR